MKLLLTNIQENKNKNMKYLLPNIQKNKQFV